MTQSHRFTELLTVAPPFGCEDEFYEVDPATLRTTPIRNTMTSMDRDTFEMEDGYGRQ